MRTPWRNPAMTVAWALAALNAGAAPAPAGRTAVAVFNFQMTSDTPEWVWLEKGLADRIITDLFQDRSVSVVRRDEMQRLAEKMRWAPEMMGDPERLEMIAILSWLVKRPPEQVLKALPVWTRSTAAAKALYVGMHLYDQGRYREAWLRFRQASQADAAYVEALYWVGKMYYFMDRYEHARRAFDRFVYVAPAHPRTGDAIKEYLHTHEKLDTPPETLLKLYDDLAARYPHAKIHNEMQANWILNELWLQTKSARLRGILGRHQEAAERAAKVVAELCGPTDDPWRAQLRCEDHAYRVAMGNAQTHNLLTGKALMPAGLAVHYRGPPFRFRPDRTEAVSHWPWPFRTLPKRHKIGRTYWTPYYAWWFVVAPDGHVFKSLHFFPIVAEYGKAENVRLGICMHKDSYTDVPGSRGGPLRTMAKTGVRFTNLPRAGLFHVHVYLSTTKPFEEAGTYIRGMRAVAELEKIGPHGAIEVSCANTSDFRVDVDGRMGRKRPGLIGLLPPGQRTLRFWPGHPQAPFGEWTTTATVRAGKTIRLTGRLPWKKSSPWASWKTAVLIGRNFSPDFGIETGGSCPYIQVDEKAIRVVWARGNDLWASASTDGETFSRPRRLPMPISSGWKECDPVLLRDGSGRFLLAFLSDRNGQYEARPYVCWSRDFLHWSAPAMILDRPMWHYDLIRDDRGRFVFVCNANKKVTALVSRDAYRWQQVSELRMPGVSGEVRIVQRRSGAYDLFAAYTLYEGTAVHAGRTYYDPDRAEERLLRYTSEDLSRWSGLRQLARRRGPRGLYVAPVHRAGRTLLACFRHQHNAPWKSVNMIRECPTGPWRGSRRYIGVTTEYGNMTWHPRWGYVICYVHPPGTQFPDQPQGPCLLRGPSVEPFFTPADERTKNP